MRRAVMVCVAGVAAAAGAWAADGVSSAGAVVREPLQPRTGGGAEAPLFERLGPEATGIDLVHEFPENADFALMTDQASGSGVCVGDIDGDGWPDLYFTAFDTGNRLYRNLGGWRFEEVTGRAGVGGAGRWCGGCAFVDIDNDGDLDLSVSVYNGPNLLYVNDGTGRFEERAEALGLGFSGASVMTAFADYDRDGDLDAYLVTHRMQEGTRHHPPRSSREAYDRGIIVADGATRTVQVTPEFRGLFKLMDKGGGRVELVTAGQPDLLYRNEGGVFKPVGDASGISGNDIGLAATWWDFDEDGYPDLYVSNDYKGPDRLYQNNQDGTFTDVTRETLPHIPWLSMGSDTADVDGDGRIDLLATDMAGSNHFNQKMGMGDMSNDRWFLETSDPQQAMRNALFLNTGTGRMMDVAYLAGVASSDWTWSPRFGDYDNDGDPDLFVTNGMSRDFMNSDLAKQIPGWRGEGWRDTPVHRQPNLAFENKGDLRFEPAGARWGLGQVAASYGSVAADLDRDGDLDLVHTNFGEGVSVYRNNGTGGGGLLVRLAGTSSNRFGIGARVTVTTGALQGPEHKHEQVKVLESARGFMSAGEPVLHFGLGGSTAIDWLTVDWPSGARQVISGLGPGQTVAVTEPSGTGGDAPDRRRAGPPPWFEPGRPIAGMVHRERPFDDFAREPLLPSKLSQLGPPMAVSRGGELFLGGAAGQPGMLRMRGGQVTTAPFEPHAESEDTGAVFFDADGDGDDDLFVVSGGVESDPGSSQFADRLYRNLGGGDWEYAPGAVPAGLRDAGSVVAAGDFDGDGDADLFIGGRTEPGSYPVAARSRLLRNDGGGRFDEAADEIAPALPGIGIVTAAAWADFDGDGALDLTLSRDWGSPALLLHRGGQLADSTGGSGLAAFSGWWNTLAAADLDGDGDTDIVAGNYGLNTKYHAAPGSPALLYFGDFDGSGNHHLVEAEFEGDVLYPGRGRSCSTAAMPGLGDRFESYRAFAAATLTEIYPPEKLGASLRLEAATLESGAFLNRGDGTFRFAPFPRLAQAAPVFGIAVRDFDGDGTADVYLVGNHFSPQPETGRMDGGVSLLLRGLGDGTFAVVPPAASGLVLPGDSKSVVVADLDGDGAGDIAVGQNDAPAVWFRGRPGKQ